jgi:hypothetical protein
VPSLDALTEKDRETFDQNWAIGESLLVQDKMAWIGTDSILPRLTEKEKELIRGYVTEGSLYYGDVFFYSDDSSGNISIVATASFSNGKFSVVTKGETNIESNVVNMVKCIEKAKQINNEYIRRQKVNYNTYSLNTDSGVVVYLAPGSVDGYYIFCGGIKTEFDKDLNVMRNTELHKSIVVFEAQKIGEMLVRSSSVTQVLNEIDIMQYLIWKDMVYNQMIATQKYGFSLYNVPDEGRIIKKVFTMEEMKKKFK